MFRCSLLPLALLLCSALPAPLAAQTQTAWSEGFEGPQPSWRMMGGDARCQLLQHQRVRGQAHSGQGCEWLQLAADNGTYLYISHDVGRPRVIDELLPSVWIRSDRAGLQLAADIVLPRVIDPRTGKPQFARVFGSIYNDAGRWQQLRIDGIPLLLARQVRALRAEWGPNIDGREAYVERVVLNVYGGQGVTNVWIDDLEIGGYVHVGPPAAANPSRGASIFPVGNSTLPSSAPPGTPPNAPRPPLDSTTQSGAQLNGSVLAVDGQPTFPRAIEYQGEPLALLKQLGFNAIWLRQLPPRDLLDEAHEVGLWVICPPPRPGPHDSPETAAGGLGEFGPEFQQVLAWDFGNDLCVEQLAGVSRWAQQVRAADARQHRPLIASARNELRGYSRQVDVLLIDRRPLGTSMELTDYAAWVRRQPLLARPGTPVWTAVQTQPNEGLRRQLAALAPGRPLPGSVAGDQIRLLVYTAISAGSRGLIFRSQSPLSATDPDTHQRATELELLNLELQLIEPWTAGGTFVATAESTLPEVSGAVLRTDRARLVLPLWIARGAQCATAQSTVAELTMLVPGTPESCAAYQLAGDRLQTLRKKRGTGGIRVTLENFGLSGMLFFAQDALIVEAMRHRAEAVVRRRTELQCALADQKYRSVLQVAEQLARHTPANVDAPQRLDAARKSLLECNRQLAAGQYPAAAVQANQTLRPLRLLERAYWQIATTRQISPVATSGQISQVALGRQKSTRPTSLQRPPVAVTEPISPVVSPGTASFDTLPWHWDLLDRLAISRPGPNLLPGGDFEQLDFMLQTGWRHLEHPVAGIRTAVDLVAEAAHSGRLGLRLTARADDPENPPAMIETPPVWITSPPVRIEAGQVIRIHGWVNIPSAVTGSVDGLLIVDSLSGDDLAERIDKTIGWKEFTLFRAAREPGMVGVTFALSGLGEVRLDDVSIEVVQPRVVRPPAR